MADTYLNYQGKLLKLKDNGDGTHSLATVVTEPDIVKDAAIPSYDKEIATQITRLEEGENNTCALSYDQESHLFAGTNTSPAKIVKLDLKTLRRISELTLEAGDNETRVSSLIAITPEIIIHGSYTNPCHFSRINGRTMEKTGMLIGKDETVTDKYIRRMVFDGQFVYAGCDSSPGKIVKFDPFTMTRTDGVTFANGLNNVFSLAYLNGYIFAGCETSPAKIVKINSSSMQVVSTLELDTGEDKAYAMSTDGYYLYIGTYTSPVKVIKVNPITMTKVSAFTGDAGENNCYSLACNTDSVFVGTWTEPSKIIKVKAMDMSRIAAIETATGYPASLHVIGPNIYTCNDMDPGRITKINMTSFDKYVSS